MRFKHLLGTLNKTICGLDYRKLPPDRIAVRIHEMTCPGCSVKLGETYINQGIARLKQVRKEEGITGHHTIPIMISGVKYDLLVDDGFTDEESQRIVEQAYDEMEY